MKSHSDRLMHESGLFQTKTQMQTSVVALALSLAVFSVHAAIFDPGVALKNDMAQDTPTNPYTDAHGGVWTFAKTTAVTNGTLTLLTNQSVNWGACFKGFSDSDSLPTIQVNTSKTALAASNGLTGGGFTIQPKEINLHPDSGDQASRFALIRFVIPQTARYDLMATFRDVSSGGSTNASGVSTTGVDVHLVVNGIEWTNAIVATGSSLAPTGAVASFTAKYCAQPLNAGDVADFIVGPNGTDSKSFTADGTAFTASIFQTDNIINLDLNGFRSGAPGTNTVYRGAAVAGSDNDYWNNLSILDKSQTGFTIPNLRLRDGLTNSTVRFSIGPVDALPMGGYISKATAWPNALMNDYTYLSTTVGTTATNRFVLSGLTPGESYNLYLYSNVNGQFEFDGWASACANIWFSTNTTKDYVLFNSISADSSGAITGLFYRASASYDAVFNGLQIVGPFSRQTSDIVNLDIDGYQSNDSFPRTFSGAARIGSPGDYWNNQVVANNTLTNFSVNKLKLTDGITRSTVCFTLSAPEGLKLAADRNEGALYNALLDDYLYVKAGTNQTFVISGLIPNNAYDLYFYCRAGTEYDPGRFIINDVAHDSIDYCFPISTQGGDCAVCSGIIADDNGSISGVFCMPTLNASSAGVISGFQIIGTIPHLPLGTMIRMQ